MEAINAAWRFSGVRWTVAIVLSLVIGAAARFALDYPPDRLDDWPEEAVYAVARLIEMADRVQFAGAASWLLWAVIRRRAFDDPGLVHTIFLSVLTGIAVSQSLRSITLLTEGIGYLHELPRPGVLCVVHTAARIALTPLLIGSTPLVALALYDRFVAIAWLRRVTKTGRGAWGGWIASIELKKYCQPLPRTKR
jgi:hypothetical protein